MGQEDFKLHEHMGLPYPGAVLRGNVQVEDAPEGATGDAVAAKLGEAQGAIKGKSEKHRLGQAVVAIVRQIAGRGWGKIGEWSSMVKVLR